MFIYEKTKNIIALQIYLYKFHLDWALKGERFSKKFIQNYIKALISK